MRKAIRSFVFWCLVVSILEIFMHQIGQDSKSIVLIRLNPLLNMIADSDGPLHSFMKSGVQIPCNTIEGQISLYWYIGSIFTFMMYGVVLDFAKVVVKYLRSQRK